MAPCDGTAYLIGKFKIRIVQDKPDPQLSEGKDVIMTNLLPWKKIDCRGLKIKKDQWIGSAIRETKVGSVSSVTQCCWSICTRP